MVVSKSSADFIKCAKSKCSNKRHIPETCYILHPKQRHRGLHKPSAIQKQAHVADVSKSITSSSEISELKASDTDL